MLDILHRKAVEALLQEGKTAAQQAQVTLAAANEMIANANTLIEKLTAMIAGASKAGQ